MGRLGEPVWMYSKELEEEQDRIFRNGVKGRGMKWNSEGVARNGTALAVEWGSHE